MIESGVFSHMEEKMEKTLELIRKEFSAIRTGHASPSILDKITVEAYGTEMPLKQLAGISAPEARLLVIQPFDKSLIASVEKALLKSDLGLTPQIDSGLIRLPIPQLTEDRRKELVKIVKKKTEDAKVALRNIRRDVNETLKGLESQSKASEDEVRRAQERVQKTMERYSHELDQILARKEKEMMEV